ncbi:MAG: ferredoxin [Candidatus Heimdallarchaeota archaeon]
MVKVDSSKCIGCGLCASICPKVFEIGNDGKSHVKEGYKEKVGCEEEAAKGCPVGAISL